METFSYRLTEVHLEKFAAKMERERPDLECPAASTVDGDPLGQSSPSTPGECQSAAAEERLHRAAEHCHRPPTTNHYYTRRSRIAMMRLIYRTPCCLVVPLEKITRKASDAAENLQL